MKKQLILTATVLTLVGASAFGATAAFAQGSDPSSGLAQRIAEKFGLKQTDVQTVVDQYRTEERAERQAEMQTKYEERLTQLVKDGKITEAQKQLILSKHAELQASREQEFTSFKNMTEDERKAAMEKKRSEMESWAKANGIDVQYVMPLGKGGPGFGRGEGRGLGN
jgi:membrane protein involved in colicin uptake